MSALRITLQGLPDCTTIPIGVAVLDDDLNRHWSGSVAIGTVQTTTPDLPNGRYAVIASLPSGQRAKQIVSVDGSSPLIDVAIEMPAADASTEKLQWAQLSKPGAFQRRTLQPGQLSSIWLRLWGRRQGGIWTVLPWPAQRATRDSALAIVQYDLKLAERPAYSEYYLQIGGPSLRWRLTALPPENVRILVKAVQLPARRSKVPLDPVELSVTTHDQHADVLLRYMRRGEVDEARDVSDPIIAHNLESRATASPLTTIVVGYYLLKTRDMKRLGDWLDGPAPSVRGTPDVALIEGWYHLRAKEPRPEDARAALLTAAGRGMPVYTRGVRLLLDGLQSFNQPDETPDRDVRAEVHSALRRVSRYAASLEWQAPTTTFFAVDPDTPTANSKEIRTGLPEDPAEVIFLAEATESDLRWRGLLTSEAAPRALGGPALAAPAGVMLDMAPAGGAVRDAAPMTESMSLEEAQGIALGEAHAMPVITAEYPAMSQLKS